MDLMGPGPSCPVKVMDVEAHGGEGSGRGRVIRCLCVVEGIHARGVTPCYTYRMPTKHPRHAITETGDVATALAELREAAGTDTFTLSELVVLGAQQKLFKLQLAKTVNARKRERLAEMVRTRTIPIDVEAADEVRRIGWSRPV